MIADSVISGGAGYNRDNIGEGRDIDDSENNGIKVVMVVLVGHGVTGA